ncbi:MAG: hypothetical protein EPN48_15040 [Microbacteriaceae bacterium]|nr:MAG: hypothetical protein EPN48_15040 [Microbacteriaceae bacterium]
MSKTALRKRIEGGMAGAVIGDALGAMTETLSIRQIRHLYGWIDDFTELRHKPYDQDRVIGAYTDDASLVIAMAQSIIDSGDVELDAVVSHLMKWSSDPVLAKFSGPSTKRAVMRIAAGEDPFLVGMGDVQSFTGATNGGAMKSAPAGWFHPGDVAAAARAAAIICTPTHNTQLAIAGAAAVAGACAQACVEGTDITAIIEAAVEAAQIGEAIGLAQGREVAGPSIERRILAAVEIARSGHDLESVVEDLADQIGAGLNTHESVPAAFGLLAAAGGDINLTAITAANIGDDTDTIGSIATAIAGTFSGIDKVNKDWYALVSTVNCIDIKGLAQKFTRVTENNSLRSTQPKKAGSKS